MPCGLLRHPDRGLASNEMFRSCSLMPNLCLTHIIELVETDRSRVIQRLGEVASYAAAELVFAQALIEWPCSRILWRHGARILRDSGPCQAAPSG